MQIEHTIADAFERLDKQMKDYGIPKYSARHAYLDAYMAMPSNHDNEGKHCYNQCRDTKLLHCYLYMKQTQALQVKTFLSPMQQRIMRVLG